MSKQLDAVLAVMSTSYGDLGLIARGQVVNAKEVADALAKANPDSTEGVCLSLLASLNPYTKPAPLEE